jgi:hypothetical protein
MPHQHKIPFSVCHVTIQVTCHQKFQVRDNFKSFKTLQGLNFFLQDLFSKQGIIAGTKNICQYKIIGL